MVVILKWLVYVVIFFFFFQAEDGIRDYKVTGVQTCALPIYPLLEELQLAFAPLHKRAFGLAVGIATALVCFAITTGYLIRAPEPPFQLALLGEYFYGFTVSWRGAVVALAGALFAGLSAGGVGRC